MRRTRGRSSIWRHRRASHNRHTRAHVSTSINALKQPHTQRERNIRTHALRERELHGLASRLVWAPTAFLSPCLSLSLARTCVSFVAEAALGKRANCQEAEGCDAPAMNFTELNALLDSLQDKLIALPFQVRGMSEAEIEDLYHSLNCPSLVFPPAYIIYLRRFGKFSGDFGTLQLPNDFSHRASTGSLRFLKVQGDNKLPGEPDEQLNEFSCFHVKSLPDLVSAAAQSGVRGTFFPVRAVRRGNRSGPHRLSGCITAFGREDPWHYTDHVPSVCEDVLTECVTRVLANTAGIRTSLSGMSVNPPVHSPMEDGCRTRAARFNDVLSEHLSCYAPQTADLMDL